MQLLRYVNMFDFLLFWTLSKVREFMFLLDVSWSYLMEACQYVLFLRQCAGESCWHRT